MSQTPKPHYPLRALDKKELLKFLIIFAAYGLFAPFLGLVLWRWKKLQRPVFALICFMIPGGLFAAAEWGLTLGFFEYRGLAKGYHFFFVEIFAIALLITRLLENWKRVSWLPPGLLLFFLYCAISLISIINAPKPSYVILVAFLTVKVSIIFLCAYNFLRTEEDLHFVLKTMAYVMFWQLIVVLKMKYWDGIYQVQGTFYHQNSLAMFAIMIGMVFLAASLGPKHKNSNLYLIAFLACAVIEQSTLSRGGLAVFAAGTMAVSAFSIVERFDRRRLWVLSTLTIIGVLGLTMTMDTILTRFKDYGNESSAKTRQLLNTAASRMLKDYRLGIGWNNFGVTINKPYPYGKIIDDWERAGGATVDEDAPKGVVENHYWLILSETGYQSLAFYLLFISVFLFRNLLAIFRYRYHFLGSLSLGIFMGCLCNYVQSILERVLTQPRNMMLWMLLLAITAFIETIRRRDAKERRRQQRQAARAEYSRHAAPSPRPANA